MDNKKAVETAKTAERQYGAGYKLIGKNYQTPDLYAKVTGQAKYAEDFRAEGMLFCKLLLSPMPHARVKRIHANAALAMPGSQSDSHGERSSCSSRYPYRQWNCDQGQQVGRTRPYE